MLDWIWFKNALVGAFGLLVLATLAIAIWGLPWMDAGAGLREDALTQTARSIESMLHQYSLAHDGDYPTGHSSTEVFQTLIDEKYCSDPTIFYYTMPGKTPATSDKLKPENVCWDVTVPVNKEDPDLLPMVYQAGYKLQFTGAGDAVPLNAAAVTKPGLEVSYLNNSTAYIRDDGLPDHIVRKAISREFDPGGKTYLQLGPDGRVKP